MNQLRTEIEAIVVKIGERISILERQSKEYSMEGRKEKAGERYAIAQQLAMVKNKLDAALQKEMATFGFEKIVAEKDTYDPPRPITCKGACKIVGVTLGECTACGWTEGPITEY